ncbi:hypothetical protein NSS60_03925 [Anoxybacillus sp. FSL W8-0382]|uniref:hypothetical protein n=1 Tax=Anoxybacillus TaxID=150247 RepID=UPI00186639D2|nr:hypothetical protein [Anoxybacillus flavithermus]MBE2920678.1 hypothetical protein [Anoxybacillus flavithermus]
MNEKGYSLVLVMLTVTVFFVIGLTIVSVSIYQAKFTQVRVEDVASLHEAVKSVEETVAELKAKVETLPLSTPTQLDLDLGNAQTGFLSELMKRHSVTIEDITDAKGIARNRNKLFTRVFRISAPYGKKTVSREVIITNAPSFLKYALGSRENVTLNGGAYIDGDIYAGKDIYVTNVANYIYNSTLYSVQTTFPTTSEKSILFANGNRYGCTYEKGVCYNLNNNRFEYSLLNYSEHELPPSLLIQKETEDFIDVDFSWTLKDKLLLAAGVEPFSYEYANYIKNSGDPEHLFNQLKENKAFSLVDDVMLFKDFIKNNQNSKSIVLQSAPSYVFENEELNLEDKWLIVDGDLYLGNNSKFKGNIIVFGDLIINGKSGVQLASTIYVTGKTSIYDTNISGLDNEQVVILSKGRLELYRVNDFNNSFSFEKENLQGYFYTESNAVIYAVGSYINIKGGLFARGNSEQTIADGFSEGVTINAYRGVVTSLSEPPNSDPTLTNVSESRFIIRHDKNVLIARGLGLPFSKRLHVIIDELSVK